MRKSTHLDPNVYKRAAEMIAEGRDRYSCCAVARAVRQIYGDDAMAKYGHVAAYERLFKPFDCPSDRSFWMTRGKSYYYPLNPRGYVGHDTEEMREHRITALLLMSDIVEAGDAD
jgi:hypothetical protein